MVVNLTNFYSGSSAQMKDSAGDIFLSFFETGPPPWNWQMDVIDNINASVTFLQGTLLEDTEYTAFQNEGYGSFTWIHPVSSVAGEISLIKHMWPSVTLMANLRLQALHLGPSSVRLRTRIGFRPRIREFGLIGG